MSIPRSAAVAADTGEADMPWLAATTVIESGLSGQTPAPKATSAITGKSAMAIKAVPVNITNKNVMIGAKKVM